MLNPIAPVSFQGIDPSAPAGYFDRPFDYAYNASLTALQSLQAQIVSIFTEADFMWRGMFFTSTGTFSVRFQDGDGYYLSNSLIFSSNFPNTPGDPFPMFPEVKYPAGGRIWIDITDTSNAPNVIQIAFVGVNRYGLGQRR